MIVRTLVFALALTMGTSAASSEEATAILGRELPLPAMGNPDMAMVILDDAGDAHIVARDAKNGMLRYLRLHDEQAMPIETITPALASDDRIKHRSGMIFDHAGRLVVWSAGRQFRRETGSGEWRQFGDSIGCEQLVELRGRLVCGAVVAGKTVGAPKHWAGGIIGGPPMAVPFAWRIDMETIALYFEEHDDWRLLAVIDKGARHNEPTIDAMAVDSADRLHVITSPDHMLMRRAAFVPPAAPGANAGEGPIAPPGVVEGQPAVTDIQSNPVVVHIKIPGHAEQVDLTSPAMPSKALELPVKVTQGGWMAGQALATEWMTQSYNSGVSFDPDSGDFLFMRTGIGRMRGFSTKPLNTWLLTWRLHGFEGGDMSPVAADEAHYIVGQMAASAPQRLRVGVARMLNVDDPAKTLEYLSYEAGRWSRPLHVNESGPFKFLYGIAANPSGKALILYSQAQGQPVARWVTVPRLDPPDQK